MEGKVESKIESGIGTVTFFHPQSNSLPGEILKNLADEITKLGNDPDVKIVILKSEGEKAFCAGADLKVRQNMTVDVWKEQHLILQAAMRAMIDCRVPIIAAINVVPK